MDKTQSSLIIGNGLAAADAFVPACWLLCWQGKSQVTLKVKADSLFIFNNVDENLTSHRKVALNNAKILIAFSTICG